MDAENKVLELKSQPQKYTASIYSDESALPEDFVVGIQAIEQELKMPVWLLIQNDHGSTPWGHIGDQVFDGFLNQVTDFKKNQPVLVLLDSPGGLPRSAYKLARLLKAKCGGYAVGIPRYAKSAATLFSLGASKIILNFCAELGPLDMQVDDPDTEEGGSALNHVQTLERLSAFALRTMDQAVMLLLQRSGKKVGTVLPDAMNFASAITRPLLENVDVVRYTEMSRILKVGEEYAERLLTSQYGKDRAKALAAKLVSEYPEHGFVIDGTEAEELGLKIEKPSAKIEEAFAKILPHLDGLTAVGRLKQID